VQFDVNVRFFRGILSNHIDCASQPTIRESTCAVQSSQTILGSLAGIDLPCISAALHSARGGKYDHAVDIGPTPAPGFAATQQDNLIAEESMREVRVNAERTGPTG
jgi:hypothetical protein